MPKTQTRQMRRAADRQGPDRRRGLAMGGVALAIAVLVVLAFGFLGGAGSPTVVAGDLAPEIPFQTFDGETVTLSDFQGTPVVLNFFASWCPACVAEMPDFQTVHAKLGDSVRFVGIAQSDVPPLGSPEDAIELRARTGITYETFQDPDGSLYRAFQGIAMPTTVFIDADGNVIGKQNGALFASSLEAMIQDLLLDA